MTDSRRINVAITRAKHFLFVIGNSKTLERAPVWKNFITDHREQIQKLGYIEINNRRQGESDSFIKDLFKFDGIVRDLAQEKKIQKEDEEEERKYYAKEQAEIAKKQQSLQMSGKFGLLDKLCGQKRLFQESEEQVSKEVNSQEQEQNKKADESESGEEESEDDQHFGSSYL